MNFEQILKKGENEKVEFKTSFDKETIITITAFTNTNGGTVFLGVTDNSTIIGININKEKIQEYLNQIKQATIPSIIPDFEVLKRNNKKILVIKVPEFPVKPVSYKGKYYKRVKNSNHQLSLNEILNLHIQSLQLSWDAYEYKDKNLDALDEKKIEKFIKNVNQTGRFYLEDSPLIILNKLRLIKNDTPTNAAMLLFAKEPLNYHIRIGRFKDEITILDDRELTLTLFEAVNEIIKFIKTYIKLSYKFDGNIKRKEEWEYPLTAIREAVLNAIIHRDYTAPSDIQIKIFDDKITIFNPGKLYGNLKIEDLKRKNYQSSIRNKLIAEAFYLTGNIEKYGTGLIRIENELKDYDVKFYFKEIPNGFLFVFKKSSPETVKSSPETVKSSPETVKSSPETVKSSPETVKSSPETVKSSPETVKSSQKIIELIKEKPNIRIKELSEILGISERSIKKQIMKLKSTDKLERKGPNKGGYWKIL